MTDTSAIGPKELTNEICDLILYSAPCLHRWEHSSAVPVAVRMWRAHSRWSSRVCSPAWDQSWRQNSSWNRRWSSRLEQNTVISRLSAHGRLKFMGQEMGVGVYTEKPFVHIHTDHRIIQKRGWALTRRWALTRENTVSAALLLGCVLSYSGTKKVNEWEILVLLYFLSLLSVDVFMCLRILTAWNINFKMNKRLCFSSLIPRPPHADLNRSFGF